METITKEHGVVNNEVVVAEPMGSREVYMHRAMKASESIGIKLYTKEEVENLLDEYRKYTFNNGTQWRRELEQWLKENL